jgi:hypothetical protein
VLIAAVWRAHKPRAAAAGRFGKVKNDKLSALAKADERTHVSGTRPETARLTPTGYDFWYLCVFAFPFLRLEHCYSYPWL